jgi:hypothetical protein
MSKQNDIYPYEAQYWANRLSNEMLEHAERMRPSSVYKPKLFYKDKHWVALLGNDLERDPMGSGKSPELAMKDFDKRWVQKVGKG